MRFLRYTPERILRGAGAVLLADLILGMVAFSVITLAALWYFSFAWLQIVAQYSAHGMVVATPAQIALAWTGELGALPALGLVLVLAVRSFRLPWNVWGGKGSGDSGAGETVDHPGREGRFHCPMCSRSFSWMYTWDSHVRNEHGVSHSGFA